jgi:hypothetical protein
VAGWLAGWLAISWHLSSTSLCLNLHHPACLPTALQARTGALVNLRDAFTSKESAIADEVTGKVETKLLDKKVAAVEEQVAKIARTELNGALPPQLARISKSTALARTSMTGANLGRTSATAIQQQVQEIEVRRAGEVLGELGVLATLAAWWRVSVVCRWSMLLGLVDGLLGEEGEEGLTGSPSIPARRATTR